jgi:hypothetical protein
MGNKDFSDLKNNKGQSMLEYILLMAVMTTIGMTLFKSKVFTDFMGPNSVFFDELRSRYAFTYRYGSPPTENQDPTEGNAYSNKIFYTRRHLSLAIVVSRLWSFYWRLLLCSR